MNQTRRTLLQAILGLIGFGAAKAVAKTEPLIDRWNDRLLLHGCPDGFVRVTDPEALSPIKPQFDAAIGVVVGRNQLHVAKIPFDHPEAAKASWSMICPNLAVWGLVDEAIRCNAMIVARVNGPQGQLVVNELMKRCPERVWHRHISDTESRPGYFETQNAMADCIQNACQSDRDWVLQANGSLVAEARALALFGRRALMSIGCDISNPMEPPTLVFGCGKSYEKTIQVR